MGITIVSWNRTMRGKRWHELFNFQAWRLVCNNNTSAPMDHRPKEKQRVGHIWIMGLPQSGNSYSKAMHLRKQMRFVIQTRKHHRHQIYGNLPRMPPQIPMARRFRGHWHCGTRQLHLPEQRSIADRGKWKRKRKQKVKRRPERNVRIRRVN